MGRKQKGISLERAIVHMFWQTESWACHRIAGSGSSKYPSPDLIASNNLRKLAIECKSTKGKSLYIPKAEIAALQAFSEMFGAEPWVAVKFARENIFFLSIEDIKQTEASFCITLEQARFKGLLFEELVS